MNENTVKQLQAELYHLRDLVFHLSANALRKNAVKIEVIDTPADHTEAERIFRQAEECLRCAQTPGLNQQIVCCLEAAGTELWAKVVDLQIEVQQTKGGKQQSDI